MATTVVWTGLDEYRELLRMLPESLAAEVDKYAEAAANGAAVDIRRGYPVRTGKLRDKVKASRGTRGRYSTLWRVTNTAPHAVLFEKGTQARHTAIGANRGSMPPGRVFIPKVIRERRKLYEQVKDLLRRKGAVVTGDA